MCQIDTVNALQPSGSLFEYLGLYLFLYRDLLKSAFL